MKNCITCGKALDDNAQYCDACGQAQNEEESAKQQKHNRIVNNAQSITAPNNKIGLGSIILWIFCISYAISGIVRIFQFKALSALFCLMLAFFLCPKAPDISYKFTKYKMSRVVQAVLAVIMFFITSLVVNASDNPKTENEPENDNVVVMQTAEGTTAPIEPTKVTTSTSEETTIVTTTELIPEMLEVYIEAETIMSEDGKINFKINTNLPDETVLMLSLYGKSVDYKGQSKVTVKDGKAESEEFSAKGNTLPNGEYELSVSMSLPAIQSDNVRKIIGEKGEYLSGDIVKKSDIEDANIIKQTENIILPIESETTSVTTTIPETVATTMITTTIPVTTTILQTEPPQTAPPVTQQPVTQQIVRHVYIAASGNGKKYHSDQNCSKMNGNVIELTVDDAAAKGYSACSKCY